jgi:serine/threonine protein kinase
MIRPLARGGMGQVYLVEHRELGSECVAKLVHRALAGQPQLIDRVRIEAEALGTLNHPNIVSVNNFRITNDGRPFIVMEYLRGRDLGRELVSGRLFTLSDSIRFTLEATAALSAAHRIGVIHRDIKPENLFLHEESDGHVTLKVLDFGVARIIPGVSPNAPTPLSQPTKTGVIIGTLRYISPEGAAGIRVDARADIYSLGLVLYRMLAGRGPFSDNLKNGDLITACLTEDPKPPSRYARVPIPPELDEIVLKALRKDPSERFQSAREFGDALTFVQKTLVELMDDSEALAFALGPTIPSPIYAVGGLEQTAGAPSAPAVPVPSPAKYHIENEERTVLAARKISQTRVLMANAILFAVVMMLTAVLVTILVFKLRQGMGTP